MMYYIRCPDGTRWKVKAARSLKAAINEIGHAMATGSVGSSSYMKPMNEPEYALAIVNRVNSDNTEQQPYSKLY